MKTSYEKAVKTINDMSLNELNALGKWYLGEESGAYQQNRHDRDYLLSQILEDLRNDAKDGEDSNEMQEVETKAWEISLVFQDYMRDLLVNKISNFEYHLLKSELKT